jgi:hypothetical protein
MTMVGERPAGGARCLKFTMVRPGTGILMQRVVVEPGALYRIRARLRSDAAFDGDAFVKLFTGDANGTITRTEPQKQIGPRWIEVHGQFPSQKRRVVYVACYVKAKMGSVWFDDVELIREK